MNFWELGVYLKVEVGAGKNVFWRNKITIGENWVTDQIKQVIEMVKGSNVWCAAHHHVIILYIGLGSICFSEAFCGLSHGLCVGAIKMFVEVQTVPLYLQSKMELSRSFPMVCTAGINKHFPEAFQDKLLGHFIYFSNKIVSVVVFLYLRNCTINFICRPGKNHMPYLLLLHQFQRSRNWGFG